MDLKFYLEAISILFIKPCCRRHDMEIPLSCSLPGMLSIRMSWNTALAAVRPVSPRRPRAVHILVATLVASFHFLSTRGCAIFATILSMILYLPYTVHFATAFGAFAPLAPLRPLAVSFGACLLTLRQAVTVLSLVEDGVASLSIIHWFNLDTAGAHDLSGPTCHCAWTPI